MIARIRFLLESAHFCAQNRFLEFAHGPFRYQCGVAWNIRSREVCQLVSSPKRWPLCSRSSAGNRFVIDDFSQLSGQRPSVIMPRRDEIDQLVTRRKRLEVFSSLTLFFLRDLLLRPFIHMSALYWPIPPMPENCRPHHPNFFVSFGIEPRLKPVFSCTRRKKVCSTQRCKSNKKFRWKVDATFGRRWRVRFQQSTTLATPVPTPFLWPTSHRWLLVRITVLSVNRTPIKF